MTAIQTVITCIAIQVNYTRLTIERIVSNWIPIILQIFQNATDLLKTTYLTKVCTLYQYLYIIFIDMKYATVHTIVFGF